MEQKYLPIGSVCTLKGKNKKVMITGYYSVEFNGNLKIKDYSGCVYPEGMLLPEQNCTFNHDDIEKIEFLGFKADEYQIFMNLLDRLTGNDISEEEKASKFHKDNDMFLTSNSTYSKLLFDENGVVMIADPVIHETKKKTESNIKFDENGTVISIGYDEEVKNPFYNKYIVKTKEVSNEPKNDIFNKYEFDENGTIVSDSFNEKKQTMLNRIEFDENGTVISVTGDNLKNEQEYNKYKFDENGTLIAIEEGFEEPVPPIGPGLPGYVEPKNKKTSSFKFNDDGTIIEENLYEFDNDGNLVSAEKKEIEEQVPPIGPGLPGYVEPKNKKTSSFKFNDDGTIIEENLYEFDNDGNLVSAEKKEMEEQVPPIGPGLPGYVEPKKNSKYSFDEDGNVISE